MNIQQGETLHKITDPESVARVVRLLLKFGWPPEPADDRDADQLEAA